MFAILCPSQCMTSTKLPDWTPSISVLFIFPIRDSVFFIKITQDVLDLSIFIGLGKGGISLCNSCSFLGYSNINFEFPLSLSSSQFSVNSSSVQQPFKTLLRQLLWHCLSLEVFHVLIHEIQKFFVCVIMFYVLYICFRVSMNRVTHSTYDPFS